MVTIFRAFLDREVLKAVWPIFVGYLPLGMACGVLAQKVGVSAFEIGLMAALVFAGSGQFIALAMIGGGASPASIILTTFIVNLRHLLYSSSLAPYIIDRSKKYLMVFAQGITDETFAMNMNGFTGAAAWTADKALALNILAHSCWILSCVLGHVVGNIIAIDIEVVSYTLTAMFIGLWSFHFRNGTLIIVGVLSGILALGLSNYLSNKLHIVVATIAAATIGCILESGGWRND